MSEPLLQVNQLNRTFHRSDGLFGKQQSLYAVRDVSLQLKTGETLGIVGESGCGKSTLARMLVGLTEPTSGSIKLSGEDISYNRQPLGRQIQYVFQDPIASLNPRKTIQQILEAPLLNLDNINKHQRMARMIELIEAVGLTKSYLQRYPHEFSGGQAQRIGIARALMVRPGILVLDEPVSALDVSIQAQILKLLQQLKQALQLSYVFISHDLSVVEHVSDKVAVMYCGSIVEQADYRTLFNHPRHPYTELLIQSAPSIAVNSTPLADFNNHELANPFAPATGCSFFARCRYRAEKCRHQRPLLSADNESADHHFACLHPL